MNLKDLAKAIGRSVPFILVLQKKYALRVYDDYPAGYVVLVKKLLYLSVYAVPAKDIKALLKSERRLLELLNADSLHQSRDWFESQCTMKGGPTRLLLSGYDLGYPVAGNAVQGGLDFSEREKELFADHEMGANELLGLQRYNEVLAPIQRQLKQELPLVQAALDWGHKVVQGPRTRARAPVPDPQDERNARGQTGLPDDVELMGLTGP